MLFASDDDLIALQRQAAKSRKDLPSLEQVRREGIDDARELRAHARTREFAWLLFVLPVLIAIATTLAAWLVGLVLK